MGEDSKKDQAPDGVWRAVPQDDDTEGHRRPPNVIPETGPDGVAAVPEDDDTEGHRRPPNVIPETGPDGVAAVPQDDEEATEG